MGFRIAAVQHGDYLEALQIIERGEAEPYFGMAYTLDILQELFGRHAHLILSLDAPKYRIHRGNAELIGLPQLALPKPIPGTLSMLLTARQICREIDRFQPTHLLLRTGGIIAWQILRYCVRKQINTLVIFANRFDLSSFKNRYVNHQIVCLLNHSYVYLAGNHKRQATDTMIEAGVDQRKAVAWDWPNARHPKDYPLKTHHGEPWQVAYVGTISESKGIGDLIDAVKLLHTRGFLLSLVAAGSGPDIDKMRDRITPLPSKHVTLLGRISNDQAFQLMLESDLICVPSRHEFPEGMPLSLTEALASRTPTIISDHPIFTRAFVEGEGIRFFPERSSLALADLIHRVLSDPVNYSELSRSTMDAFRRVECPTTFGNLIERWKGTF